MKQRSQGFTLIEVLIALVILALSFTAIIISFSENARNVLYLENKTLASWVASDVLSKTQVGFLKPNTQKGNEKMLDKMWYWQLSITNTPSPAVKKALVSVKEAEAAPAIYTLTGYLEVPVNEPPQ